MARYLTEFIGTFFLVFTIGMVVTADSALAPLAIGAVLMVMVYLGGHISGAHYNPAVTVALLLRGKLSPGDGAPYLVAQLLAAFLASGAVFLVAGDTFAPVPGAGASAAQAFLAEALFTFALVLVILNVATAKATEGNDYYGLAIGFRRHDRHLCPRQRLGCGLQPGSRHRPDRISGHRSRWLAGESVALLGGPVDGCRDRRRGVRPAASRGMKGVDGGR